MRTSFQHKTTTMKKQKIAIIGTVGLPARYGGFETLAEQLVDNLGEQLDFTVYCSAKRYDKAQRQAKYKGARLIYLPLEANGIQSIPYDIISILHALFYADVLLILGVSGGLILPFVRLFTRKKIIISIDGIEWKRAKWSKLARWYLWFAEELAVRFSHADIADNEAIQSYTAMRYQSLSSIIEYGADHATRVKADAEAKKRYVFLNSPYAFKVCRIEPENNVHIILEAFARLPQHRLVVVGNWHNSDYGIALRKQYSHSENLFLLDPIYNQCELDMLRSNALLYLHGHSAGGTNPSLVEAMHLGLPILAFDAIYNRTTTEGCAMYFKTTEDLVGLIRETPIRTLAEMGKTMGDIARRRYTWAIVAHKYGYLVNKVMQQGQKGKLAPEWAGDLALPQLQNLALSHLSHSYHFYEKR